VFKGFKVTRQGNVWYKRVYIKIHDKSFLQDIIDTIRVTLILLITLRTPILDIYLTDSHQIHMWCTSDTPAGTPQYFNVFFFLKKVILIATTAVIN
jgi:hypothetical protein